MSFVKYPLSTEKSIRDMESVNRLLFVVDKKATKSQIKDEVEKMFDVKVVKVNTLHTPKGKKRAFITFDEGSPAIDLATKLGLM